MGIKELKTLKGIGETTAQKLLDRGYNTIASIAVMRNDELAAILTWSKMKALETINDAKERSLTDAIRLFTIDEYKEEITDKIIRYHTGSNAVDAIIGGGISTNELTGLRGEYSTGKTQLCLSTAISCIAMGRKVAIVETEPGTLFQERIAEIASIRGVKINGNKDMFVIPAKYIASPNHQFLAYERIAMEIEKGMDIGLIIIDSFAPKFREFYPKREMFPARSQEIMRHIGYLQSLAANYNLAVLITNQVMGVPDTNKQKQTMKEEASDKAMVLGHVLKHSVQTWLALRFQSKTQQIWKATLFDSSHMPYGVAEFRITAAGVTDISGTKGKG